MTTKENILNIIRSHKSDIEKFGVKDIGLYGSYVREEQSEESDIDLLVDLNPDFEKFDNYMALYDYLEHLFRGEKVEIVTKSGLSPYIGPKILNEVVYVDFTSKSADFTPAALL